jgi:RimJ/RimL family protein N-acetyltransferase
VTQIHVLYGHTEYVRGWVKARIEVMQGRDSVFGASTALGVMDKGKLIAGVVFHNWQPGFRTIEISCAAESPRWAVRGIMSELLSYPFGQIGVNRVTCVTAHDNARTRRFLEGLGMTLEGVGVAAYGDKDAAFYRLLKSEWEAGRFHARELKDGQAASTNAA